MKSFKVASKAYELLNNYWQYNRLTLKVRLKNGLLIYISIRFKYLTLSEVFNRGMKTQKHALYLHIYHMG